MSLRLSFKLTLPLAALALLVAFAAWPGVRPETANAAFSSFTANATIGGHNQIVTVTIAGTDDNGTLTLDNNSNELFSWAAGACDDADGNGQCDADLSASGGATLTLNTNNVNTNYTLTFTLQLSCASDVEVVTVTAVESGGDVDSESLQIACAPDDDAQVIVRKDAVSGSNFDFTWDATGGDCVVDAEGVIDVDNDGSFELDDNDSAAFYCETAVSLVVNEQDDAGFTGIDDCDEGDSGIDDINGDQVTFDISDIPSSSSVTCTWENNFLTPTVIVGPVTSVTVQAANIASCGGTTAVQVTLRNASGGPAPAGTSVTATSSAGGSFQPASTLTGNFPFSFATFLYQAPATFNGVATIRVTTDNGVSGSVNIQVVCGVTTVPAPIVTAGPLKPPSAGDGGLLNSGDSSGFGAYLPSTLAASLATLVVAGTLAARRRSAVALPITVVSAPVRKAPARSGSDGGSAVLLSLALIALALFLKRPRS